jgi:hypothetical protein
MTVADAAAASGLALRDAEVGLQWLVREYRGHLRVGEKGDLVYSFPYGFRQPWKGRDAIARGLAAIGRGLAGLARFVLRAWVAIVLVGYTAIFVALLVAVAAGSRRGNRGGGHVVGGIGPAFFRLVADAAFWTFHPFSPFAVRGLSLGARRETPAVPFYEKVNRFVFGPPEGREDPLEVERRILAAIRAGKGRIGLADVMRVTGLPRETVDSRMARLLLDYDGTVEVSNEGGITYAFPPLRLTAREDEPAPRPAWERPKRLAPLTGNGGAANAGIALLNGFNLVMAAWAIGQHLTIANVHALVSAPPHAALPPLTGLPIALGVVPLVMSLLVFALPIVRALFRGRAKRAVAGENGRLAIVREVLERIRRKAPITDRALGAAWRSAAGREPDSKTLTREVVALGGDVDLHEVEADGEVRYRFPDLQLEHAALEDERAVATDEEKQVGRIVFATDG